MQELTYMAVAVRPEQSCKAGMRIGGWSEILSHVEPDQSFQATLFSLFPGRIRHAKNAYSNITFMIQQELFWLL